MKDLLIQPRVYKALLEKTKKLRKMDNDEWKEMNAKAVI
jgi:hypothetical protein